MKNTDFVVRFAGEGGQGFLSAAIGFASANTKAGYHAQTFATFPSQITGGPTWMQTRISIDPVLSRGDEVDVLVVFNEYSYETHKNEVKENGFILYDSDQLNIEPSEKVLGIAFEKLAKTTGNTRAANMVMMGALAELVGVNLSVLEDFVKERWGDTSRYGEQIVPQNIEALKLGSNEVQDRGFKLAEIESPIPPNHPQIFLNGNEAISLGAYSAGVEFYVGYPISPATTILVWMEKNLVEKNKFVYQVSSEIEAITAIIGASYGGKKAMTATAGPGFSLMSEGLGLAWMAEIPVVVVDVQRGGPATGLPTKTEQSDLNQAIYGRNGEAPMVVLAAATPSDCFIMAYESCRIALKYMIPVILLSDGYIANGSEPWKIPDINTLPKMETRIQKKKEGYAPYNHGNPDLARPWALPGTPGMEHRVGGLEKWEETGHVSYDPENHQKMVELRQRKVDIIAKEIAPAKVFGKESGDLLVIGWGGTHGAIRSAVETAQDEGMAVSHLHLRHLNPFPQNLGEILVKFQKVMIAELNLGQLSTIIRSKFLVDAVGLNKIQGKPFTQTEVYNKITKLVKGI